MKFLDSNGLSYFWEKIKAYANAAASAAAGAVEELVAAKQDTLTGTQGQVVGFNAEGKAVAQDAPHGGGSGSAEVIYSSQEQVIGRWIDNRPLYRKTLEVTTDIVGGEEDLLFSLHSGESIKRWEGYIDTSVYRYPLSYNESRFNIEPSSSGEGYTIYDMELSWVLAIVMADSSGDSIYLLTGNGLYWPNAKIVVTIEYTKAAD